MIKTSETFNGTFFDELEEINSRPEPFSRYTAGELWSHEYISEKMLEYHLNGAVDVASRRKKFIDVSVKWITSKFKVGKGTKIVDFGCGPGLYTQRLARNGARVTGIDFSERSIGYAQESAAIEGLNIHYVHQNYLEWETKEKFDLILMIMCDFTVLSPLQRAALLKKFRSMLTTGGMVLMDVYSLTAFGKKEEKASYERNMMDGFWDRDKYYGFLNTYRYEREKVALDKYTIIGMKGRRTIYNWFQFFSLEALEEEFTSAGLEITEVFGDVAGNPFAADADEFAVVAA